LDIRDASRFPSTAAGIGFLGLLEVHENALEHIFVETFTLLDEVWVLRGASYMEFNSVMAEVKLRVSKALSRRQISQLEDFALNCSYGYGKTS
jgi:hypothetical protein